MIRAPRHMHVVANRAQGMTDIDWVAVAQMVDAQ